MRLTSLIPCPLARSYSSLPSTLLSSHDRALEENDLFDLSRQDASRVINERFEDKWAVHSTRATNQTMWTLIATFGWHFALAGILKLVQDALTFAGPIFLNLIVSFVGDPSEPLWYGLVIVLCLCVSSIIQSLALQIYFHNVFRIAMHVRTLCLQLISMDLAHSAVFAQIRAAIVSIVYKKSFLLSPKARQGSTVGDIVNHMSIDADRLMNLVPYLHMVWSGPLQVIGTWAASLSTHDWLVGLGLVLTGRVAAVSVVMLYFVVSWSVFAGVAVMVLMIPLNSWVVKKVRHSCLRERTFSLG